jgi:hypothetical protein
MNPSAGMVAYSRSKSMLFTLKITLLGTNPAIWRRVEVLDCITLEDLHNLVQCVMGWENCHLHQFFSGKERFGEPSPNNDDYNVKDESQFMLGEVLKRKGAKLKYEYDFGDSWLHEIELESKIPSTEEHTYPVCLGGARNCPPEDIGGVWGYAELVESVLNPRHPRRRHFEEWLEGTYDPDGFDLKKINKALGRMKYRS